MSRSAAASLVVAACALVWGFVAILVREVELPAMAIVFYRVALSAGAVALALVATGRRRLLRPAPRAVLATGLLLALHWSAYFAAIKETSIASAVLITYTGPAFMALLAPPILGERVPRSSLAALAVSLCGVAAITLAGAGEGAAAVRPLGAALAVVAALSFALLLVVAKRTSAGVDPFRFVLWQSLAAAAVLSPAAVGAGLAIDGADAAYLLALGVGLTGVVGVFFISALGRVPATSAGILMYVEPVSAAVLAALLLGEALTLPVIGGGLAIVLAGVWVVLRAPAVEGGAVEQPLPPGAPAEPALAAGSPARGV